MVVRLTIATMLVLASLISFSQGVAKEEADSLLNSLSERKTDVEQMDIFLKVAEYYILLYRNTDITKNNEVILHKNEQLQHFLTEKEWLAKEIHRVKNNFHLNWLQKKKSLLGN